MSGISLAEGAESEMRPIVSQQIRLRHPDTFAIGEGSIVDDFCYFSTRVEIGRFCHIATGCSVGGGVAHLFRLGDFSSLSAGVRIWCASDDFTRSLITLIPPGFGPVKEGLIEGDVILERFTGVGANSVVMPENHIPEGVAIGALSFVPPRYSFEPWMVYAGIPIHPIRPRDREAVLRQHEAFLRELERVKGENHSLPSSSQQ